MSGSVEGHTPWPWEKDKYERKIADKYKESDRIGWETRGWGYARVVVSLADLEKLMEGIADTLKEMSAKLDEISKKMPKEDEGNEK